MRIPTNSALLDDMGEESIHVGVIVILIDHEAPVLGLLLEDRPQVVGVGAVSADEARSFTLTVEATPVAGKFAGKGRVWH